MTISHLTTTHLQEPVKTLEIFRHVYMTDRVVALQESYSKVVVNIIWTVDLM